MKRIPVAAIIDIACSDARSLAIAGDYDGAYLTLQKSAEFLDDDGYFSRAQIHGTRAFVAYQSRDKHTAIRETQKAIDLLRNHPTMIDGRQVGTTYVQRIVCDAKFIQFLTRVGLNESDIARHIAEEMLNSGIDNRHSRWTVWETDESRQKLYRQVLSSHRWNFWFYRSRIRSMRPY